MPGVPIPPFLGNKLVSKETWKMSLKRLHLLVFLAFCKGGPRNTRYSRLQGVLDEHASEWGIKNHRRHEVRLKMKEQH